jgi:quinoprotein glucose dehydrogenase
MRRLLTRFTVIFSIAGTACLAAGQAPPSEKPYSPTIAAASDEAAQARKRIRVPSGLRVDLFAAEPMLANPVCFCVDNRNRFYVVETFRLHAGVTDARNHMDWLDDDLACRTVADRVAMYRKHLGKNFATFEMEHDRIRLLEDATGNGKADKSTVFADGFHHAEEGLGAGLAARQGKVWFACIPNLWLLQDGQRTGRADVRQMLQHGYGVHVGFIGHDLHGLRFGPDGKLYFSIGDRGLHVRAPDRIVDNPDSGAVLRCNPDGSELEIVATGLRNPQELAFDQYGNLFTGDNNADHGDKARWVYVVEGGDSGWRIGYQFMNLPVALGPWNAEKLWYPAWEGQAAYIVPPIANVADGPAGLTYHPGTARLTAHYREHFFLVDFRGSSGQSGIRSFAVKPKGASFDLVDQHEFVWSVLATDVDFGTDGALYLTDWVEGWNLPHKGRIYKVHDAALAQDAAVASVQKLLAEGMAHRSADELGRLLEHADMRVRQEAQFALVDRFGAGKEDALRILSAIAHKGNNQLARLHAIWAMGQIGRRDVAVLAPAIGLLKDRDPEVRAQAAKVVGDGPAAAALEPLMSLMRDPQSRVRFFAAMALGKLGRKEATPALLHMLRDNADRDAFLRHAGVMALSGIGDREALHEGAKDSSAAVRLAVLLTYRRLASALVAGFLNDADPRLVLEAARAINDVPISAAMPHLAALSSRTGMSEPLLYRVLNAHFRLGKEENARALAAMAARQDVPWAVRVEALRELGDWAQPSGRDRIVGLWRPLSARPLEQAASAVRASLGGIFAGPDSVRQEAAHLAGKLGIQEIGPVLRNLLADKRQLAPLRVEALQALEALHDSHLTAAVQAALADSDGRLRAGGLRVLAKLRPSEALPALRAALDRGDQLERQGALATLGDMTLPATDGLLAEWLDKLLAGQVPLEIQLDLLEAARQRRACAEVNKKLARYQSSRSKTDPLGRFRETLAGGDADRGRRIFFDKTEVYCARCHKIRGIGGEVGPDLTGIGAREKREYLLESIVDPNRQIAKGFETVMLGLKDGQVKLGILKGEDDKVIRLLTAEGQLVSVNKDDIEDRSRGKSAMPEDIIKSLTRTELRDLVEFLAGLK